MQNKLTVCVPPTYVADYFSCLLHTIIFNRALGNVRTQEHVIEKKELKGFTYVKCNDVEIEKKVNEYTVALKEKVVRTQKREYKVKIEFKGSPEKYWTVFTGNGPSWDTWEITMALRPDPEDGEPKPKEALRDYCLQVIQNIAEQKEPLPSIKNPSKALCYAMEVEV